MKFVTSVDPLLNPGDDAVSTALPAFDAAENDPYPTMLPRGIVSLGITLIAPGADDVSCITVSAAVCAGSPVWSRTITASLPANPGVAMGGSAVTSRVVG